MFKQVRKSKIHSEQVFITAMNKNQDKHKTDSMKEVIILLLYTL